MICKICKKRNHKTSECFHKKQSKNRKISFQNKAPKTTEPTKPGIDSKPLPKKPNLGLRPKIEEFRPSFKPAQNPKLGLETRDAREYFPSGILQSTPPLRRKSCNRTLSLRAKKCPYI